MSDSSSSSSTSTPAVRKGKVKPAEPASTSSEASDSNNSRATSNTPVAWVAATDGIPLKQRNKRSDGVDVVIDLNNKDDLETNLLRVYQHTDFENKGYLTLMQLRNCCYLAGVCESEPYELFMAAAESVAVANEPELPSKHGNNISKSVVQQRNVDDDGEYVTFDSFLRAIKRSPSRSDIEDMLKEMNRVLHAEIGYTFDWQLLAFPAYFIIPNIVTHVLSTALPLQWGYFIVCIVLFIPPFIYVLTPHGYKQFQCCFELVNQKVAMVTYGSGIIYLIVLSCYYAFDGQGVISTDLATLSAYNTSASIWAFALMASALPSATRLSSSGSTVEQREMRRLDSVPAESEYVKAVETVGDVFRCAKVKAQRDSADRRGWGEIISFWGLFIVVATVVFFLAPLYRTFVSEDKTILPLDWVLFVAQGIGNVLALYTIINVYIYHTKEVYYGMTKLLRLAGSTINSEEAAREGMPFIPLFRANNDYAYIVLRSYITKFYKLRAQAQASFKFSLVGGATLVCFAFCLVAVSVRALGIMFSAGIPLLITMLLLSAILIAALVFNETLGSNNHRVAEEVLYTQTRMEDSSVIDVDHVNSLSSMNDYFQNHTVPLEILSIPITPRTLMALRAGVGGFVVLIYSTFINPNAA